MKESRTTREDVLVDAFDGHAFNRTGRPKEVGYVVVALSEKED